MWSLANVGIQCRKPQVHFLYVSGIGMHLWFYVWNKNVQVHKLYFNSVHKQLNSTNLHVDGMCFAFCFSFFYWISYQMHRSRPTCSKYYVKYQKLKYDVLRLFCNILRERQRNNNLPTAVHNGQIFFLYIWRVFQFQAENYTCSTRLWLSYFIYVTINTLWENKCH